MLNLNPIILAVPALCLLPGFVSAQTAEEALGAKLFSDASLSLLYTHSCATCHTLQPVPFTQAVSFADAINAATGIPVSMGTLPLTFGILNAPSAGYAAFTPTFQQDANTGEYLGGQFWNGRSDTLADQAEQPLLNPVEMRMPSKWAVVSRLKHKSSYVTKFKQVYDINLDDIPSNEHATSTDAAPDGVDEAFRAMAVAIGEFEKTKTFNRFTSKYDFYLAGQANLNASETRGMNLFNGSAGCNTCHTSEMGTDAEGRDFPPLFTNHKYYNLGLPKNATIGQTDIGLAGNPAVINDGRASGEKGKHRTVSLRNVAISNPYFHNGVMKNLKQAVHFLNTRDTLWESGTNLSFGFGWFRWPSAEVRQNETHLVGDLGLSNRDENDLVNFLETLTDGYNGATSSIWTDRATAMITAIPQD